MLVSYTWLKEVVDFSFSPEALAHRLSMQGIEASVHERLDGDTILLVEPTANRPDCLSVLGLAREIRAMGEGAIRWPNIADDISIGKTSPVAIDIQTPDLCPRYAGVYLKNIVIQASPEPIRQRLESMGIRSINNVVDITNYVLLECGHPTHAFDAARLQNACVRIGLPEKGWATFQTLDGLERSLRDNTLLIKDGQGPIALAGIMGGQNSEIQESTKEIFLESAYFHPPNIRCTSRRLGLSTESSYRFERGADIDCVVFALRRLIYLLQKEAKAHVKGDIMDHHPAPIQTPHIVLREKRIAQILGCSITLEHCCAILEKLDFAITKKCEEHIEVEGPPYRADVTREIDLIEEVARIYGYQNIELSAPRIRLDIDIQDPLARMIEDVRRFMVVSGYHEVINYSFIAPDDEADEQGKIVITNPLSQEQSVMRTSLVPGLLKNLAHNQHVKQTSLNLFEIGRVYHKAVSSSDVTEGHRLAFISPHTYGHVKGMLEALCRFWRLSDVEFAATTNIWMNDLLAAGISSNGCSVGFIGNVHEAVTKKYDIEGECVICSLDLDAVLSLQQHRRVFQPISKYPAVERDLALILDETVSFGECCRCIQSHGGPWLRDLRLFDIYRGDPLPLGKKSLGFSLSFRDDHRTLTEDDVEAVHKKILEAVHQAYGATLREK